MSWIDAAHGGADAKVRRCFYLRGVAVGGAGNRLPEGADITVRLNDQLPQNYVLRVQGAGCMGGVAGLTAATAMPSTYLVEARLYGAFTTERIYESQNEGGYIVLGWFTAIAGAGDTNGGGAWLWQQAPPVEARSTGNGMWRLRLFNHGTNATLLPAAFSAYSFAIDVRAGGPVSYPN
jgi:hypothetical protein